MKFCHDCGKELEDDVTKCPECGYMFNDVEADVATMGVLAVVFGAAGGLLGLILGIIGLSTYKKEGNRRNCKGGIALFFVWVVIIIIMALT